MDSLHSLLPSHAHKYSRVLSGLTLSKAQVCLQLSPPQDRAAKTERVGVVGCHNQSPCWKGRLGKHRTQRGEPRLGGQLCLLSPGARARAGGKAGSSAWKHSDLLRQGRTPAAAEDRAPSAAREGAGSSERCAALLRQGSAAHRQPARTQPGGASRWLQAWGQPHGPVFARRILSWEASEEAPGDACAGDSRSVQPSPMAGG